MAPKRSLITRHGAGKGEVMCWKEESAGGVKRTSSRIAARLFSLLAYTQFGACATNSCVAALPQVRPWTPKPSQKPDQPLARNDGCVWKPSIYLFPVLCPTLN